MATVDNLKKLEARTWVHPLVLDGQILKVYCYR